MYYNLFGISCKAVLNRWCRIISSAMGYYEAMREIHIVWLPCHCLQEYHWCATFIEKRADWYTQAVDNRNRLEIVVCRPQITTIVRRTRCLRIAVFYIYDHIRPTLLALLDLFPQMEIASNKSIICEYSKSIYII